MDFLDVYRVQIGRNIKKAREKAGYNSQRKLAGLLSFSHTKLSEIERGLSTASRSDLIEISNVLGVSYQSLISTNREQHEKILLAENIIENGYDVEKAEEIAHELFETSSEPTEYATAKFIEGKALLKCGKFRKALICFEEMYLKVSNTREVHIQHQAKAFMARTAYDLKDYSLALRYTQEAMGLARNESEAILLQQLRANIYADTDQLESALEVHKSNLNYYRSQRMDQYEMRALNNIGDVLRKMGRLDEAVNYFVACNNIAVKLGSNEGISRASYELAKIYLSQDRQTEARTVIREALEFCISIPPLQKARLNYLLGICSTTKADRKKYIKEAYDLIAETDDTEILIQVCRTLGEIYEAERDIENALRYYKIACNAK